MKSLIAVVFALLMPVAALAADPSVEATEAAKSWLALVDAGNYAQSWSDSSALMKTRVSQESWAQAVKPIKETLGAVVSREFTVVEMMKTLPGAPDGEYAIVRFKTKFEKKADSKEAVTMMLDGGKWRSAGYFIE